ncbi:hypothetical protein C9993_05065, partial [Marinobacter sp. Z-F4-2]
MRRYSTATALFAGIVLMLLLPALSYAEDYYWEAGGQRFASPSSACQYLLSLSPATAITRISIASDNSNAACFGRNGANQNYGLGTVWR